MAGGPDPAMSLLSLPGVSTASAIHFGDTAAGSARVLPVPAALSELFPWGGVRRGSTVVVRGSSLLLAVLGAASASGAWIAVVAFPELGWLAAAETGVVLERVVCVPAPGRSCDEVIAALLDGLDVVVVGPARVAVSQARRLSIRARYRGSILVSATPWPDAELELSCSPGRWSGTSRGYGRLRSRRMTVRAKGRGAAARPKGYEVFLPGPSGRVTPLGNGSAALAWTG